MKRQSWWTESDGKRFYEIGVELTTQLPIICPPNLSFRLPSIRCRCSLLLVKLRKFLCMKRFKSKYKSYCIVLSRCFPSRPGIAANIPSRPLRRFPLFCIIDRINQQSRWKVNDQEPTQSNSLYCPRHQTGKERIQWNRHKIKTSRAESQENSSFSTRLS